MAVYFWYLNIQPFSSKLDSSEIFSAIWQDCFQFTISQYNTYNTFCLSLFISQLGVDERITVERRHSIHWYHALYGILAFFGLVSSLFRPGKGEVRVQPCVPDIALRYHHIGSLSLHDHGVNQIFIGFLLLDQFLNYEFVDAIDPMWNLFFFVLFSTEFCFNRFLDNFLDLVVG